MGSLTYDPVIVFKCNSNSKCILCPRGPAEVDGFDSGKQSLRRHIIINLHWRLFHFTIPPTSNTAAGGRRNNVFSLKIAAALHLLNPQPHHKKNSSPSLLLPHPHTDIHSAGLAALRESNCWFMFHHEDSLRTPLSLKALG